ncbi:cupin domain protein [Ophiostoma piceae UAMH 11346]|uniref:Cupin domain protein n=1 Tax=Ophiostoma piceae (strain UAMH 11346) TaxID=1262450 RepID=S3BS95_OPHP1|nr:cupin domain protein [Ophiostoma piceae UAMH 11346]
MSDDRPPAESQLATGLPGPVVFVTGHDDAGKAVLHSRRPVEWMSYDNADMQMSVAWTTPQFPVKVDGDQDITAHDALMAKGSIGLVSPGGTVLRYVDLSPGYECLMHRTVSVDYGIVLEGTVVSKLENTETGKQTVMRRGDVMVQRATMHSWYNPSKTEWARMVFCLQDCEVPRLASGKKLREDLGRETPGILPSGNDKDDEPGEPKGEQGTGTKSSL